MKYKLWNFLACEISIHCKTAPAVRQVGSVLNDEKFQLSFVWQTNSFK